MWSAQILLCSGLDVSVQLVTRRNPHPVTFTLSCSQSIWEEKKGSYIQASFSSLTAPICYLQHKILSYDRLQQSARLRLISSSCPALPSWPAHSVPSDKEGFRWYQRAFCRYEKSHLFRTVSCQQTLKPSVRPDVTDYGEKWESEVMIMISGRRKRATETASCSLNGLCHCALAN